MASLRILDGDGPERVVELRDRKLLIGRGRDNDIVLPDSQKGVSRTHAELRYENGRYIIVDLQSQNGTWLNGQRVERAEVPPDAEITVGEYRLRFQHTDVSGVSGSSTAHLRADLSDLRMHETSCKSCDRQEVLLDSRPTTKHVARYSGRGDLEGGVNYRA